MILNVLACAAGCVVPVIVYRRVGWWLNSDAGVYGQSGLLFVLGLLVTLVPRRERPSITWWFPAASAAVGAIVVSSVILFWIGPGTIFPIVLVAIQLFCAVATLAGAAVVNVPMLWRQRRPPFSHR